MYTSCLFCHRPFGSNEVFETFPVGRRLAFDADHGRLWVVCRRCQRWNLTPIEERWETVEECERRFRATRLRYSTANIGLAVAAGGVDLIRVGRPLRPEFAAWRYGRRLLSRRRQAVVAGAVVAAAMVGGAAATGGVLAAAYIDATIWVRLGNRQRRVALLDGAPQPLVVRGKHLGHLYLATEPGPRGWALRVAHDGGTTHVAGERAVDVLWQLMPRLNPGGGSSRTVQQAALAVGAAGGPGALLRRVAAGSGGPRPAAAPDRIRMTALRRFPASTRLAIEMAVHEAAERDTLDGELTVLERAWREAEEIAAIADALPDAAPANHGRLGRRPPEAHGLV